MNNLAPMKNCPGGMQGNLNWMPGYNVSALSYQNISVLESKLIIVALILLAVNSKLAAAASCQ